MLAALGGGCQTPVGALALTYDRGIRLWGLVASVDGKRVVRGDLTGGIEDPENLGLGLADLLRRRGADELLEENAPAPPVSHP